VVQVSK